MAWGASVIDLRSIAGHRFLRYDRSLRREGLGALSGPESWVRSPETAALAVVAPVAANRSPGTAAPAVAKGLCALSCRIRGLARARTPFPPTGWVRRP